MKSKILESSVFEVFPRLHSAPSEVTADFFDLGNFVQLPPATTILNEGDSCKSLALLLKGRARVFKLSESGREITLYRVHPGEICILTASCLLSETRFPAFAVTETDIDAIAIPADIFRGWMIKYPFWQEYVFGLLSTRLAKIMAVVEEVAFGRVDSRIAAYLLAGDESLVKKTHFEIATEIGTSREVVSRILKDLEHNNIVSLSRGSVHIDNSQELHKIANTI